MSVDVVVVGGGSAGSIVAARLSEDPGRSVLLLEAGPGFTDLDSCPTALRSEYSSAKPEYLWHYLGDEERTAGPPLKVIRGKCLGGSSSVNGMVWMRGLPADYDEWQAAEWTNDALAPYFAKLEREIDTVAGEDASTGGMVPISRQPRSEWGLIQSAFLETAIAAGHTERGRMVVPGAGVGPITRNSFEGVRFNSALAYLCPALDRSNLTVRCDATVDRLDIVNGKVIGVHYTADSTAEYVSIGEVVLSSGVIESPHVLMLSGIGPAAKLEKAGIDVQCDLPGVGENLTDHPIISLTFNMADKTAGTDPRYLVGLVYSTAQGPDPCDVQVLAQSFSMAAAPEMQAFSGLAGERSQGGPGVALIPVMLYREASVGSIELNPQDPAAGPTIRYNYLSADTDRIRLRESVRMILDLVGHEPMASVIDGPFSAPDAAMAADDQKLDAWIAKNLGTALHGCGTARIGPSSDTTAVVDPQGRVHGVEGVRVADLAIARQSPRAGTMVTAMVIGERIAGFFDA